MVETVIEKSNEFVLDYILSNKQSIFPKSFTKDYKIQLIQNLINYKNKMVNGSVKTTYSQRGSTLQGRSYSKCSLQMFPCEVRNSLAISTYVDIDIVNAQHSIMNNYADDNNIYKPNLENYIKNRNELLKESGFNKIDITSFVNGDYELKNCPDWLQGMKNEYNHIIDKIYFQNKDLVNFVKKNMIKQNKKNNERGKVLSQFYNIKEKQIIDLAINYLESQKFITSTKIHDGFLVEKDNKIDNELNDLNLFMSSRGHKVKFIIKPMKDLLDIPKSILFKKKQDYEEDQKDKYQELKEKFESKNAKILNPFVYITDNNGEKHFEKATNIKSKFIDWREASLNGKVLKFPFYTDTGKPKTFIENYINDPMKKVYDNIDFIPSLTECPDNVYNLFTGFNIFKLAPQKNYSQETQERFDKLLNHFKFLVNDGSGNEEEYFNYLIQVFAHMILNPLVKTKVLPILKSKEGWGKNIMTDFIGKNIMGDKYHLESRNASKEIFGDFNGIMAEKLFVVFDEADPEETKVFYEKLKGEITNDKFILKRKGIENTTIKSFVNYIATTNNEAVMKLSDSNRRFALFECTQPKPSRKYFEEMAYSDNNIMDDKEVQLMFLDYIKSIFDKTFDFSKIPKTKYLKRSYELSKIPLDDFFNVIYQEYFENGVEPYLYTKGKKKGNYSVLIKQLYEKYKYFLINNSGEIISQRNFKKIVMEKEIFKLDSNSNGVEFLFKKDELLEYLKLNDYYKILDNTEFMDSDDEP